MSKEQQKECTNTHIVSFLNQHIAMLKSRGDIKKIATFKKAINSISAYPLPIFSGKECEILNGIGPSISKMIDNFVKKTQHPLYPQGPNTPLKKILNYNNNKDSSNNNMNSIDNDSDNNSKSTKQKSKSSKSIKSKDIELNENKDKEIKKKSTKKKIIENKENIDSNIIIDLDSDSINNHNKQFNNNNKKNKSKFNFEDIMPMSPGGSTFQCLDKWDSNKDNEKNNNISNFSFDFGSPLKSNHVTSIFTPTKTPLKSPQFNRLLTNSSMIYSPTKTPLKSPIFKTPKKSPFPKFSPYSPSKFSNFDIGADDTGVVHWSPKKTNITQSPHTFFSPLRDIISPKYSPRLSTRKLPLFRNHFKNDNDNITPFQDNSQFPPSPFKSPIKPVIHNNKRKIDNQQENIDTTNKIVKLKKRTKLDFDNILDKEEEQDQMKQQKQKQKKQIDSKLATIKETPKVIKKVMCIVDNREVKSVTERDFIVKRLGEIGVKAETRKLELGDFLWIAVDSEGTEWMLDYIVERKRIDDLSSSIIDGRYKEQKFRLSRCGCSNMFYLVEGEMRRQESWGAINYSLPIDTLTSALISTYVQDEIIVRETSNIESSIQFIKKMTEMIDQRLISKKDQSIFFKSNKESGNMDNDESSFCSLDNFNRINQKNKEIPLKEFFAAMLMQISGCSSEKAAAIVNLYPTPLALIKAYNKIDAIEEKDNLLKEIRYGKQKKKIGQSISKLISTYYCNLE